MELHQLRAFVLLAKILSFTDTADKLHMAQPALTRKIKRLEAELGVDLFERKHNRVYLLPSGERLLPVARTIIWLCDDAVRRMPLDPR